MLILGCNASYDLVVLEPQQTSKRREDGPS